MIDVPAVVTGSHTEDMKSMASESRIKSRKSPEDLVRGIFQELPVRGLITVNELALKLHSKWITIEEYLNLIKWIQEQPRIESVRIGTRRYAWRREQK